MTAQEQKDKAASASLVSEVAASVEIEEIRFDRFAAQHDRTAGQGPMAVQFKWKASAHTQGAPEPKIVVQVEFLMQASPDQIETAQPCCEISAQMSLTYSSPKASEFSKEHLSAFAQTNGIYNAWPYWRELVQSCTARMGLPALTVPSLKMGRLAAHQAGTDERKDEQASVPHK